MNFDRALRDSTKTLTGKRQALVSLFLLEEESEEAVPSIRSQRIRKEIRASRSRINPNGVTTYLSRLQDDNLLTSPEAGKYRLTHDGREEAKNLLPEGFETDVREGEFLETGIFDQQFYKRLKEEIESCYRVGANGAVLVLTRKLFENLLIDILRGHYGMNKVEVFFNPARGYHRNVMDLKANLISDLSGFKPYSRDLNKDNLEALDKFKKRGDASAHSIVVKASDEEIEELSSEATRLVEILYDAWVGVRLANDPHKEND